MFKANTTDGWQPIHSLSAENDLRRENQALRDENDKLRQENQLLRTRLERAKRVIGQLQVLVRRFS
ncbi:MAG TPA: hypothetical protein V6D29_09090 [Leptolyngbyaceae cyanobacterium]